MSAPAQNVIWEVEGLGTRPTDAAVSALARLLLSIAERRIAQRKAACAGSSGEANGREKPPDE